MPISAQHDMANDTLIAQRIRLRGRIQGVGFRPFTVRLAKRHDVRGWVRNVGGEVEIHAEGRPEPLARFVAGLTAEAPQLARPDAPQVSAATVEHHEDFRILDSGMAGQASHNRIVVPPDHFVCPDCLAEMADPQARRYRYPFTNCTQCGPRYTIIDRLPYDRPNTAMAGFELCADCRAEYDDPADRRFHAQPLACPRCGPTLEYLECHQPGRAVLRDNEAALAACVESLRNGLIVAVKGVGGYHLLCDARSDAVVARLRARKRRPAKPFAVMLSEAMLEAGDIAAPTPEEGALLRSAQRPIVLAAKKAGSALAAAIAPGLGEVGLLLPYSPLHHLLVQAFDGPLVATSANISGEPVLTDAASVEQRLGDVADAFLHHDRPIRRPADDSVFRTVGGTPRPIRLGRGHAPLEFPLRRPVPSPLLAVGADLKNTVALAIDDRVIVSPHQGDLGSLRGLQVFAQVIDDLCRMRAVEPEMLVCDAHPGYFSTRWASARNRPLLRVGHHAAHASAVYAEAPGGGPMLVFTWDGLGWGDDQTLWGGEALLGTPGAWRRVASLRPFRLIGGDRASRDSWRCALALCLEAGVDWHDKPAMADLAIAAWEKRVNSPQTSSVGRLFDAAAALIGVTREQSYEGEAAMRLEALATGKSNSDALPLNKDGALWRADWAPLLPLLMSEERSPAERAALLHATLAATLREQAVKLREESGVARVGLAGGVFQNRVLVEHVLRELAAAGFTAFLPERLPVNDAAIAFGQIVEAQARLSADPGRNDNFLLARNQ